MQAAEFDVYNIPLEHPDSRRLSKTLLMEPEKTFDLVFCDGQALRTHEPFRQAYRESSEATRLLCSQLVIALQHMQRGGTLIMLLHKVEAWDTMNLIVSFDGFSTSDSSSQRPPTMHEAHST
jgi:hypothetical protein